jgi:hypothetical protein
MHDQEGPKRLVHESEEYHERGKKVAVMACVLAYVF